MRLPRRNLTRAVSTSLACLGLVVNGCAEEEPTPPACPAFTVTLPGSGWEWMYPPIAWTGSEYGIAYGTGMTLLDVRWATVDETGIVTASPEILSEGPDWGQREKGMAYTGSSFVMVRAEDGVGVITTVDRAGARLAPDIVMDAIPGGFALWNGADVTVALLGRQSSYCDPLRISLLHVSPEGIAQGPPTEIQGLPSSACRPLDMVWNGSGISLLLYEIDESPGGRALRVMRLDPAGRVVSEGIVARFAPDVFRNAALAVQGADDLVAYVDDTGIFLLRIRPDGIAEGPTLIEAHDGAETFHPALGATRDHLFLFISTQSRTTHFESWLHVLDERGAAVRPPELLATDGVGISAATMIATEERMAVSWGFLRQGTNDWHYLAQRCP